MEKCERHQLYADNNYYPFTLKLYKNKRSGLFDLLEPLHLKSSYQESKLLSAAKTILGHRQCVKKSLPFTQHQDIYPVYLELVPEKIRKIAIDKEKETIEVLAKFENQPNFLCKAANIE